jgi:hypothetical protein
LLDRPLQALTEADLQDLVDRAIQEDKYIDYKDSLPSPSREGGVEFLADVSAFANAAGGHLVYGMVEKRGSDGRPTGIPERLEGLGGVNTDAEVLRLESVVRDGIKPRIPGVAMRPIGLAKGNSSIVIRVPRSWAAPHVVDYQGHWRFYARSSAGKYPLDVGELRAAFNQAELTSRQVSDFRIERVAKIVSGETPVPLAEGAKTALHLIPLSSFDPSRRYDVTATRQSLLPIYGGSSGQRTNFEGIVSYSCGGQRDCTGYVQVFRSGKVEAVDAELLETRDGQKFIPSEAFEGSLIGATDLYRTILMALQISPPVVVTLSLLGVRGYSMAVSPRLQSVGWVRGQYLIDRDDLLVPETTVEDLESDGSAILRPLFDSVWNAAGWDRCMNYDDAGDWNPR